MGRQSHPSWVCGLKQFHVFRTYKLLKSHPSWVCGLKLFYYSTSLIRKASHPSWVCGLKLIRYLSITDNICHTLRGCVD